MKLTKLCVLLFAVTLFASCKQEEKAAETEVIETTNTVEKETVIIKDSVNVPAETNGTSIKVNSNGVEIDSKDVDVKVN